MLLFVPLEIIILAPIIWLTDRGSGFYNANRAEKIINRSRCLSSMYVNSYDLKNPDGSTFNSDKDPRVMLIGKFLCKTRLDEIPLFLNISFGDMSFIGP